jgi:hypothetical protein
VTNYFLYSEGATARRFTWLVIVLILMCILKSVQDVVIVWQTIIENFANPDVSMMLVGIYWWHYTTSLTVRFSFLLRLRCCKIANHPHDGFVFSLPQTAIIATFVQGFFAYRYWMLTKRWWASAIMALGMIISMVGAVLVVRTKPFLQLPRNANLNSQ